MMDYCVTLSPSAPTRCALLWLVAVLCCDSVTAQVDTNTAGETAEVDSASRVAADETPAASGNGAGLDSTTDARHDTARDNIEEKSVSPLNVISPPIKAVPIERIREAVRSQEYLWFPRSKLDQLSGPRDGPRDASALQAPTITRASYRATFSGDSLTDGMLRFHLNSSWSGDSCVLGRTNLREMVFRRDGNEISSAALPDGRLSLLTGAGTIQLNGSWSASGTRGLDGILFELLLPPAAVTELQLMAADNIRVTSTNAVVKTEEVGDGRRWSLFPRASHAISFVCAPIAESVDSPVASALVVDTSLRVSEKTVFADWTIVVPSAPTGSSVAVTISDGCKITDVLSESGGPISWELTGESGRQLVMSGLQAGRTVAIHGSSNVENDGALVLPLLAAAPQMYSDGTNTAVPLRSTGFRLVVPRGLAVHGIDLDGLYQQEVSYNATGEQIIELRQFAAEASAAIHVEPSSATVSQKLLIHRPSSTPGTVTVYAAMEPRSDHQTYQIDWHISGPWQPTSVEDLHTHLPLYSRIRPAANGVGDLLQVELRSAATSLQPAWLRIEFRSTRAITPQTSSLPILINDRFRSAGTWILSAATAPFPAVIRGETIPDPEAELESEFSWLIDDLEIAEPNTFQMIKSDRLQASVDPSPAPEPAIPRATLDYQLQLTETAVTEDIQLRLTSTEQIPEAMILLFPEGIDVQLVQPAANGQISPTGRTTEDHWQEWLLALPSNNQTNPVWQINLRVTRPTDSVDFAAIPRLPNTSDVTLSARRINNPDGGFAQTELIAEPSNGGDAESFILEPGTPVFIKRVTNRVRLNFSRTNSSEGGLRIRGTAWIAVSAATGGDQCLCLADLVVSRSGSIDTLTAHWPDATEVKVFVDDQPLAYPVRDSTTQILLPPDQATIGLRILWTSRISREGWGDRFGVITLPQFDSVTSLNLGEIIQLPAGCDAATATLAGLPAASNSSFRHSPQVNTTSVEIREFLMRWRLASDSGATSRPVSTENGQFVVEMISYRWLFFCALLAFWIVIAARRFLSTLRSHILAALILAASALAAFGTPVIMWLSSGGSFGLAVLLVRRECWEPLFNQRDRVELPAGKRPGSTAASASAIIALLLTGQAPVNSELPPVLINENAQTTSPFVLVRKDLLPAASNTEESDVRVLDVIAHVRVEPGGGVEISVDATVASRRTGDFAGFTVPVESATLTECSLDEVQVAPLRDLHGRPQVRIQSEDPTDAATDLDSSKFWGRHRVAYTLRSDVTPDSGHLSIRVPLPYAVRTRLTLETIDDPILTARLSEHSGSLSVSGQSNLMTFPVQYNRGPLDIVAETQFSQTVNSGDNRSAAVTCRVETTEDRTRIICRYQLTSQQPLPTELTLTRVPGYEPGAVLSNDRKPLILTSSDGNPIVHGNREQVADFQIAWEPSQEQLIVDRVVPAAALEPPAGCGAERVLLAVQVSAPLKVHTAIRAGKSLSEFIPGDDERESLHLTPSDQVYLVEPVPGDIRLQLEMRDAGRRARMEQKLIAGVEQLDWSCTCFMDVSGPDTFRQRLKVPPELLVDQVRVSAGGANRLKSWSCRDGSLLVSFREGTRGEYQLSFEGIVPIPDDGRVELLPARLEATDVLKSSLDLTSRRNSTVRMYVDDESRLLRSSDRLEISDTSLPLKLSIKRQQVTKARLMILAFDRMSDQHATVAVRIHAGDQGWDGRIRLPDEFSDTSAQWITNNSTRPLPVEGGELPAQQLLPGESATLLVQGKRVLTSGTAERISLPILEPQPAVEQIQVYLQSSESDDLEEDDINWMVNTLEGVTPAAPPSGLVQQDGLDDYDDQDNSIRLATMWPADDNVSPVRAARRAARSIAVTHLHPSGAIMAGTTDILIEFGDADESVCLVPSHVKILTCQLDETDVPQSSDPTVIIVRRQSQVQRLTIEWWMTRTSTSYLPQWHRVVTPSVESIGQEQFLTIHTAENEVWSAGDNLTDITIAQFETRLGAAFPETPEIVTQFLNDHQDRLARHDRLFVISDNQAADLRNRRRLAWPQWIPIIALVFAGVVTGSRRISHRLQQEATRNHDNDPFDHAGAELDGEPESTPSAPGATR